MADKYINATQMLVDEQEAYMTAQLKVSDMTQKINQVVHMKLQQLLFDAPAEDVQEVRHAKWKGWTKPAYIGREDEYGDPRYVDRTYYRCSECDYGSVVKSNFCPNCGVRMDGD